MESPLKIVVCVKPVPDPDHWGKLKLDPATKHLSREEVPSVINPLDRHALEQAISMAEDNGGDVTVVSMAPPSAESQLRETLAMGAREAYLLSDPAFAGADTLATARCLAAAIEKLSPVDLILCGAQSLDGSTAQVGPQLAELLGLPDVVYADRIEWEGDKLRVRSQTGSGYSIYETDLPVLITVSKELNHPRMVTMGGIATAREKKITVLTAADLGLDAGDVGLAGSPSRMRDTYEAPTGRRGELIEGRAPDMARTLVKKLRERMIIER